MRARRHDHSGADGRPRYRAVRRGLRRDHAGGASRRGGRGATDSSLAALRWAIDQARWTSGPPGLPGVAIRAVLAHSYQDLYGSEAEVCRQAEAVLDVAVDAVASGPPVEVVRVVREGHPTAVLAEEARHASMLVLGTRAPGTTGAGPITARLVGNVDCPVVVIPEELTAPRVAVGR